MWEHLGLPVRSDLDAACTDAWRLLGRSGSFWSGVQRVLLIEESRNARSCRLCSDRLESISPVGPPGTHDIATDLPEPAVDAVHRIVTDPGRLTESWVMALVAALSEPAYVELIGVLATTLAIDTLARGLGAPLPPPPSPLDGDPTGELATEAVRHSAWIRTVPPDSATGELASYYQDRATNPFGFVGNVHRALSLVPDEQFRIMSLLEAMYVPMSLMGTSDAGRALRTPQIELIAATVSLANSCFY